MSEIESRHEIRAQVVDVAKRIPRLVQRIYDVQEEHRAAERDLEEARQRSNDAQRRLRELRDEFYSVRDEIELWTPSAEWRRR